MELKNKFFLKEISVDNFRKVLFDYFHTVKPSYNSDFFKNLNGDEEFSITVKYNSAGKIQSVVGGKKITQVHIDDINAKITTEILADITPKIARAICYITPNKSKRFFRFGDKFQILPLPDDAPEIKEQSYGYHPILLEYKFDSTKSQFTNAENKFNSLIENSILLHLLTHGNFDYQLDQRLLNWVMIKDEENNPISSQFIQTGYFYNDKGKILEVSETFSDTSKYDQIEYSSKAENEITLIDDAQTLLSIIYSLDKTEYQRFFNACYWYYIAKKTDLISKSNSYVCLVTAIECLIENFEKCSVCHSTMKNEGIEICSECNEPIYRIGKTFENFLIEFSNEEYSKFSKKQKRDIYSFRSDKVHGTNVFKRDYRPIDVMGRQSEYEDAFHRAVSKLVFKAIVNWLYGHKLS